MLKSELEKIQQPKTISELLNYISFEFKDSIAVGTVLSTKTYHEMYHDILKVVGVLTNNNVLKGEHFGILCDNDYNFVIYALGVMYYGAVSVLLPIQLDNNAVFGLSKKYNLKGIFYENPEQVSLIKDLLLFNFNDLKEELLPTIEVTKSDNACIVLTGGTTGKSKGAILSHQALLTGTYNGTLGFPKVFAHTYYSLLPLTHVFGFIRNTLTCFLTGSSLYFPTSKQTMFKEISIVKPTILILVPGLAEIFLNLVKQYTLNFIGGKLLYIVCGGALVPPYLVSEWNKLGVILFPGYGLTESANLVSGNPEYAQYPSSVGFPYANQELKIVDDELWLKGDNLFSGYYNEPLENESSFSDGWFKTGDLARIDENGLLYITGRIKDIIIFSNGENVSPLYLESLVNNLPFVQDSLVYGSRNELNVEILVVEVLLRKSVFDSLNVSSPQEFIEQEIANINKTTYSNEQISKVIIRNEDFKRTPALKIIRPKGEF
jgi:long-chain acyl-CoA synthetase